MSSKPNLEPLILFKDKTHYQEGDQEIQDSLEHHFTGPKIKISKLKIKEI